MSREQPPIIKKCFEGGKNQISIFKMAPEIVVKITPVFFFGEGGVFFKYILQRMTCIISKMVFSENFEDRNIDSKISKNPISIF